MNLVKIGKKGQVTIPKGILREVGISGEAPLSVETTKDGTIVLRQVGVYPIEIYTEDRTKEFKGQDRSTAEEETKVQALLKRKKKR